LPVIARRDTAGYRAAKFVGRHKTGVAAAALIFLSLTTGIVATLRQTRIARAERDKAQVEKAKADRINSFLRDMLSFSDTRSGSPNTKKGHDATLADMLDVAGPRAETELNDQLAVKAEMLRTIGAAYTIQPRFDLAEHYGQGPVHSHAIAERQGLPEPYLNQLMTTLRQAGLVTSKRGPAGGHTLSRPAAEISLRDAFSVLEGTTSPWWCVEVDDPDCQYAAECGLRPVWQAIQAAAEGVLDRLTLADLHSQRERQPAVRR